MGTRVVNGGVKVLIPTSKGFIMLLSEIEYEHR